MLLFKYSFIQTQQLLICLYSPSYERVFNLSVILDWPGTGAALAMNI